jgi:tripartite-type tricarboxylate transporter receptor subunit TctC
VYPSRPVRIIVGFEAVGKFDLIARVIGEQLAQR